ncbi:MAG: hypothetical protein K0T53_01720 [Wolbachia pipientis]|nr:hypothetical protein [Wolbachia pipientis]
MTNTVLYDEKKRDRVVIIFLILTTLVKRCDDNLILRARYFLIELI